MLGSPHRSLIAAFCGALATAAALSCGDGTAPTDPVAPMIGGTYVLARASDAAGPEALALRAMLFSEGHDGLGRDRLGYEECSAGSAAPG